MGRYLLKPLSHHPRQRGLAKSLKNKWNAESDDEASSNSAHEEAEERGNEVVVELRRLQRKNRGNLPRYLEDFVLQEVVDNYRETVKDPK